MITPEVQAILTSRCQRISALQKHLEAKLAEIERTIKHMRADIESGSLPRYHSHVLSHSIQLNDIGVTMQALNQ